MDEEIFGEGWKHLSKKQDLSQTEDNIQTLR
jgi:hypothetical protein